MSHLILQFTEIKKYKLRDNIQGEKPIFYIVENSENILKKLEEEIKKYIDQKVEMKKIVENLTGETFKNSNSAIKEIFNAKIMDY